LAVLVPTKKQAHGPRQVKGKFAWRFGWLVKAGRVSTNLQGQLGQAQLDKVKRFDMPGFRPRPDWIREIKRYGILAADAAEPVDCYRTKRRYW